MEDSQLPKEDGFEQYVTLVKDGKIICRTQFLNSPVQVPPFFNIFDTVRKSKMDFVSGLPSFALLPACQSSRDQNEWIRFLRFLLQHNMVGIMKLEGCEFYILPPDEASNFGHVMVAYRTEESHDVPQGDLLVVDEQHIESAKFLYLKDIAKPTESDKVKRPSIVSTSGRLILSPVRKASLPSFHMIEAFANRSDPYIREGGSATCEDECSPNHKFLQGIRGYARNSRLETCGKPQTNGVKLEALKKNYVRADPSYLKTLGQTHSGWIFGAIAELVDNSKDAKATRLDISVETIYLMKACKDIPMLSVIDDGHGMNHQEIVRMTSFGHRKPDRDEMDIMDHIGRFGIGFKTGAMRLGRDALVLTQTANSRSIAFLSQSLNEGKENLEIPIVSYRRQGHVMELNTDVQSEALAKYNLKAIKEFSPFNKYLIGVKAGLFSEKGTGTQIYIWNLDEWGSDYCLEWKNGICGGSSFHQGDIFIRSRRNRSRPGQISQMVPLDYSLRAYLEVIFLDPRMKIYLQGSLVKSRPLAKSLKNTVVVNDYVMGRQVQLILGCSQIEWELANGGIFLYWHGRLIEAYKRVGGMVYNSDVGRGLIGVVDVTYLMNDANGLVWVHNNKQGFQDCEAYLLLENWLGSRVNEYWDKNYDILEVKNGKGLYNPDHDWVQCDKCRKWRMLRPDFDTRSIPQQWFCYMTPFEGSCETPEQKVEPGVITVSTKRSGYDLKQTSASCKIAPLLKAGSAAGGNNEDDSRQTVEDGVTPSASKRRLNGSSIPEHNLESTPSKRLRRGAPRVCKNP